MKKKLLLAGLLFGTLAANAQLLNGTFNDEAAVAGWTVIDADGDTFDWTFFEGDEFTEDGGFSGAYAASESWTPDEGALTPDNYLLSPLVNIPAGGATLTFKTGYNYYAEEDGAPEELDVYVTTQANPTVAQLQALTSVFNEVFDTETGADYTPVAQLKTVNLAAYAGQSVKIVFRHHNAENQDFILLDDVIVTAGTAGIKDNLASTFTVSPNPTNSIINISNANNTLFNAITVADINGRTVKSSKFDGVYNAQINVSDLAAGVYMMTVTSDKGNITKKIVKN